MARSSNTGHIYKTWGRCPGALHLGIINRQKHTPSQWNMVNKSLHNSLAVYIGQNVKVKVKRTIKLSKTVVFVPKYTFATRNPVNVDYCNTIWGNCSNELIDKVFKFPKRAARVILDKDLTTPSSELFQQLRWMKFDDRVKYRKCMLMYNSLHNLAPTYLGNKYLCTQYTQS